MKKALFFLVLAGLAISCSKDEERYSSGKTDGRGEYLYSDSGGSGGGEGQGGDTIQSGQITAGEWNDLSNWDFWNNLGQNADYTNMPSYWSYNFSNRISVKLQNMVSENLCNIMVELLNDSNEVLWTAKTDNSGNAELFPRLKQPLDIPVENMRIRIGTEIFSDIHSFSQGVNIINIEMSPSEVKKAEIAFVIDATGSMGDELEYLKVELIDVIGRVKTANPDVSINLGSVFYRDTDDEYVTRISGFSSNINSTIDFIKNQAAGGGGDFPEAVHTALNKAVNDLQWSANASSRIIFLVLDAPPHYEPQIVTEIQSLIALAADKGIKIIPVTASGIDKETEFLMRYMSIATNGTYVFITGHSGIGGEHLEPTVGEYEVELLNDLIERLINKYIQ